MIYITSSCISNSLLKLFIYLFRTYKQNTKFLETRATENLFASIANFIEKDVKRRRRNRKFWLLCALNLGARVCVCVWSTQMYLSESQEKLTKTL